MEHRSGGSIQRKGLADGSRGAQRSGHPGKRGAFRASRKDARVLRPRRGRLANLGPTTRRRMPSALFRKSNMVTVFIMLTFKLKLNPTQALDVSDSLLPKQPRHRLVARPRDAPEKVGQASRLPRPVGCHLKKGRRDALPYVEVHRRGLGWTFSQGPQGRVAWSPSPPRTPRKSLSPAVRV